LASRAIHRVLLGSALLCAAALLCPRSSVLSAAEGERVPAAVSDFPIASVSFGTSALRRHNLKVYPPDTLTAINLGFDGSDGGETTPLSNRPPQDVTSAYFPFPLTSLRYWASSYNPIGDTLDFTGFSSLEAIECFHCSNIEHVVVSKLPSLKRVCFEQCNLQELDLTGNSMTYHIIKSHTDCRRKRRSCRSPKPGWPGSIAFIDWNCSLSANVRLCDLV